MGPEWVTLLVESPLRCRLDGGQNLCRIYALLLFSDRVIPNLGVSLRFMSTLFFPFL